MEATYDYSFFLFSQLWILNNPDGAEMPYDLMFGEIITDWELFLLSDFYQDNSIGEYESIINYFSTVTSSL
jgi:hypothetical protein